MSKHPHAELMLLYAQDAMETERPWERWEARICSGEARGHWMPLCRNPDWYVDSEYRRKPRTHKVNGFDVPEPMREAPEYGTRYWVADPTLQDYASDFSWEGVQTEMRWLIDRGIVHATKEAAIANAKAMLGIAP